MLNLRCICTLTTCFFVVTVTKVEVTLSKPLNDSLQQEPERIFVPETFMKNAQRPASKSTTKFSSHDAPIVEVTERGNIVTDIEVNGTRSEENYTETTKTDNALGHNEKVSYYESEYEEGKGVNIKTGPADDGIGSFTSTVNMDTDKNKTVNGATVQQSLPNGSITSQNIHGTKTETENYSGNELSRSKNIDDLEKTIKGAFDDFLSTAIEQNNDTTTRDLTMERSTTQVTQNNDSLKVSKYKTKDSTITLHEANPETLRDGNQIIKVSDATERETNTNGVNIKFDNKLSTLNVNNTVHNLNHNRYYNAKKDETNAGDNKDGKTKSSIQVQQHFTDHRTEGSAEVTIDKISKPGNKATPLKVVLTTTGQQKEDFTANETITRTKEDSTQNGVQIENYQKDSQTKYGYDTSSKDSTLPNQNNNTDCEQQPWPPKLDQVIDEKLKRISAPRRLEDSNNDSLQGKSSTSEKQSNRTMGGQWNSDIQAGHPQQDVSV